MSLGPTRSDIRRLAQKRSDSARGRVEKPSNPAALPQETPRLKRRDYYTSAGDTRRGLYRSETQQSDPIRYNRRLDAGFVAQVLGQLLPTDHLSKQPAYAQEKQDSARLLDRRV